MIEHKHYTTARCPRCHRLLLLSPVEHYSFYCSHCDEDFYSIEVRKSDCGPFTISIYMEYEEFMDNLKQIQEIFSDAVLLGWDIGVCEIGFNECPTHQRLKDIMQFFKLIKK